MIRFADPLYFSALAALPLLAFFSLRRRSNAALRFSSLRTLVSLKPGTGTRSRQILLGLRLLGMALLITAFARPQSGRRDTEMLSEGVDIALVMDTSGSMQALDFELGGKRKNRLEVVKDVVTSFIKARNNDRIGMVVFGEDAFTQCPQTLDYGVLLRFLDEIQIGMAGDATAIGSGLATAVKRLKDLPSKSKVVILLTDGSSNAGAITPEYAAKAAATYGIKVYTIGVGSKGKAPFLVDSFFGQRYVYRDVDMDEDTLRMIAKTTGGRYFRATDTASLRQIYTQIDAMEKTEVKVKEYIEYNELFAYFLIPGVLLILGEIALGQTRFRRLP